MSAAMHVTLSPKALRRVRNLIRGRPAYLVPALPSAEDLDVADQLGVPLLAPEPEVAQLYSSKSGAKRIFTAAGVDMPPTEFDIYSAQQLVEALAGLVTRNIAVRQWLFKIDNEFHSRGLALLDVAAHMPCYSWAVREAERYGDNWRQSWAHEPALLKVSEQLPALLAAFARPLDAQLYTSWQQYLDDFLAVGGVIEAVPPTSAPPPATSTSASTSANSQAASSSGSSSTNYTCLSVAMLVEPTGRARLLSSGDHLHLAAPHANPFFRAAFTLPQCSIEAPRLNDACLRIARACFERKIVGYVTVDFVTFLDPRSVRYAHATASANAVLLLVVLLSSASASRRLT